MSAREANRRQSVALIKSEGFDVIALKWGTKHQIPGAKAPVIADWLQGEQLNWAIRLPAAQSGAAWVDLDIDVRPREAWQRSDEVMAGRIADGIVRALAKIGGIDCRHRFGRQSQGGHGHLLVPLNSDDRATLARLNMKTAVRIDDVNVKVELRFTSDASKPRHMTVPGSVYAGRADAATPDPLVWALLQKDLPDTFTFPQLPPQPLDRFAVGLWAGLLCTFLSPLWTHGNRHDLALVIGGVLARETQAADFLGATDAAPIMQYVVATLGDDDVPDRMKCLEASLAALERGEKVTGYTRLGEYLGEEAVRALKRVRGGADPDTLDDLINSFAYVAHAPQKGEGGYVSRLTRVQPPPVYGSDSIKRVYHPHPRFPPYRTIKGTETPLISIAMQSPRIQRFERAVQLPGVPFWVPYVFEEGRWREATETERATPGGDGLALNLSPGFATEIPASTSPTAMAAWNTHWRRLRTHLTRDVPAAVEKLEGMIGFAIQQPLVKVPFAPIFSAGSGVGKSFLFNGLLTRLLGRDLIGFTTSQAIETPYRGMEVPGTKFLVVEEADFRRAPDTTREWLKDLVKNPIVSINRKYGAFGPVENFAFIVFLTNQPDIGLSIRGQHDRSVAFIEGETQSNLSLSAAQWQEHINGIADEVRAFLAALDHPETGKVLREAGMAYFNRMQIDRDLFNDNSALGDVSDKRDSLLPAQEAFATMLERGEIYRSHDFDKPFTFETLRFICANLVRQRGASTFDVHPRKLSAMLQDIFGKRVIQPMPFRHKNGKIVRVYYFNLKYGSLLQAFEANWRVKLEPAWELRPEDFGANPPPSLTDCHVAFDLDLATSFGGANLY